VAAEGRAERIVRRSRFVGLLSPCRSAAEAAAGLAAARAEFPKADHHASAWRVLDEATGRTLHRHDDDGEPGGTAGRPMLQVLEAHRLVNALVVGVRYFGGIKLGAGGLVRAYAGAAVAAVGAATLAPLERRARLEVRVEYTLLAAVEGWLAREGCTIAARGFDPDPWLRVEVPLENLAAREAALAQLTNGRVSLRRVPA
jgi:uncharacterized YigZ family protein